MDIRQQAVTGVIPPDLAEARIRERWPSVARNPAVARLGKLLTRTIILAPLAWLLMAGLFFSKLGPFFARRFTLTNRRVMIRKGWSGKVAKEVPLSQIDDVRVVTDANSDFFRAGNLEIISNGQVAMTMVGVPEPESFRHSILDARNAWVPGKVKTLPFIPASAK
jgi:hypothetical protein